MKNDKFDKADLSEFELPADEPLSSTLIESYQELAKGVVKQAISDLDSSDPQIKTEAIKFCIGQDPEDQEARIMWLGWLGVPEDALARAASQRLRLKNAQGGLHRGIYPESQTQAVARH